MKKRNIKLVEKFQVHIFHIFSFGQLSDKYMASGTVLYVCNQKQYIMFLFPTLPLVNAVRDSPLRLYPSRIWISSNSIHVTNILFIAPEFTFSKREKQQTG